MKGPHAAALAAGWLAVALSMAALATAAISRVGTETSGAQAQVTITMTATVRATPGPTAPSSLTQLPGAPEMTAQSTTEVTAGMEAATQVQATRVRRSSTVSRMTVTQPFAAPAASTSAPVVLVPTIDVPSTPTATPTATKSTKTPTPSATTKNTTEADGTITALTWAHRQGGIHAGCLGERLAYAEPWATTGYRVEKSYTWIRTAIFFNGSAPLTVLVGCQGGHPTFSTFSTSD